MKAKIKQLVLNLKIDDEDKNAVSYIGGRVSLTYKPKSTIEMIELGIKIRELPQIMECNRKGRTGKYIIDFYEEGTFPEPMTYLEDLKKQLLGMI